MVFVVKPVKLAKRAPLPVLIRDNGSKLLSPEEMLNTDGTSFSITINFDERMQSYSVVECRETLFYSNSHKWFKDNLKYCKLRLRLEVSAKGRLHWHGTIEIKGGEIGMFYLYDVPRLLLAANIELDKINDPAKWNEYCRKQSGIFDFGGSVMFDNDDWYSYTPDRMMIDLSD